MYYTIIIAILSLCLIILGLIAIKGEFKIKKLELRSKHLSASIESLEVEVGIREKAASELGRLLTIAEENLTKHSIRSDREASDLKDRIKTLVVINSLGRKRVEKIKRLRSELSIANKSIRNLSEENKNLKKYDAMNLGLMPAHGRMNKHFSFTCSGYKEDSINDKNTIQALKSELSTIKNMNKDEKGAK